MPAPRPPPPAPLPHSPPPRLSTPPPSAFPPPKAPPSWRSTWWSLTRPTRRPSSSRAGEASGRSGRLCVILLRHLHAAACPAAAAARRRHAHPASSCTPNPYPLKPPPPPPAATPSCATPTRRRAASRRAASGATRSCLWTARCSSPTARSRAAAAATSMRAPAGAAGAPLRAACGLRLCCAPPGQARPGQALALTPAHRSSPPRCPRLPSPPGGTTSCWTPSGRSATRCASSSRCGPADGGQFACAPGSAPLGPGARPLPASRTASHLAAGVEPNTHGACPRPPAPPPGAARAA
jgi:hypothetical protein